FTTIAPRARFKPRLTGSTKFAAFPMAVFQGLFAANGHWPGLRGDEGRGSGSEATIAGEERLPAVRDWSIARNTHTAAAASTKTSASATPPSKRRTAQ